MPDFLYWATTEIGDTVTGRLSAASPDDAAHLLTLRGLVVQRLEEDAAAPQSPVPDQPAPVSAASLSLTDDDFIGLSAAVESATQANLPLTASLRTLAEESNSPRFRLAVSSLVASLEQGEPLSEVLVRLPSAFPRRLSVLVDAGTKTGKLPFLMHHALEQLRRTAELRRRVWQALAYPALICVIAMAIIAAILLGLVPTFKGIFQDFGTDLPGLTKAIIAVSDASLAVVAVLAQLWNGLGWPVASIVAIGCLAGLAGLYLFGNFRPLSGIERMGHRLRTFLPIIGPVFRAAALSNLFRFIAILVDAGLSLPEALRLAGMVTDDTVLTSGMKRISADLERGVAPIDAVRNSEALPREVLPIFRWADNRRLFLEALRGAADIYAARSQLHAGVAAVILQPTLIFGIGLTAGLVFLAMFLPLIKLLNDLA